MGLLQSTSSTKQVEQGPLTAKEVVAKWQDTIIQNDKDALTALREGVRAAKWGENFTICIVIPHWVDLRIINRHLPSLLKEAGWPSVYAVDKDYFVCGSRHIHLNVEKAIARSIEANN